MSLAVRRFVALALVGTSAAPALAQPAAKVPAVPQDAVAQKKLRDQWLAYHRHGTLEAYDKVGKKDPKWDFAARKGLDALAEYWAAPYRSEEARRKAHDLLQEVVDLGCPDPLVGYAAARLQPDGPAKSTARVANAAAALAVSKYPAAYRAHARNNMVAATLSGAGGDVSQLPPELKKLAREFLDGAVDLFPEVLLTAPMLAPPVPASPDAPPALDRVAVADLLEIARVVLDGYARLEGDRKVGFDRITAKLGKDPTFRPALLLIEGQFLVGYAWDARGFGPAAVKEDDAKLFKERLTKAEEVLSEGWKESADQPAGPTLMLSVVKGLGHDRAKAWTWFDRAMKADGDNLRACQQMADLLHPKWGGTDAELLAFGLACLRTANWDARLPTVLASAHRELARSLEYPADHYHKPQVWNDVQAVYEGILKKEPTSGSTRAMYAWWAYQCGQYKKAVELFDKVDENDWPAAFLSKDDFLLARVDARRRAPKGK
jgi:tetratricopeptide (TPR) repeat protein